MLTIAVITPYVCFVIGFQESKYIFIIFYGYVCFKVWEENKPDKELGVFWQFCQPFLFGSIGASIVFNDLGAHIIGKSLLIIFVGLIFRWFATFFATAGGKYTSKERMFMAYAWMPKATV